MMHLVSQKLEEANDFAMEKDKVLHLCNYFRKKVA
jgi:hypothetical protein